MAKTFNKHESQLLIQILFVFLLNYFFSGWFRQLIFQNLIIAVTLSLSMILLIIQYQKNRKIYLLLFSFLLLFFFQTKTTNIKNTYSLTPSEVDQQITRMNYYPPTQAKLGYILEHKREVKVIEKCIENFIEVLDFNQYFPDYFSYLSLPLFFIGVYWFVKSNLVRNLKGGLKIISGLLLFTIIILSLFGVNGKCGPFLIFPFIILFIYIGLNGLLRIKKNI